MPAREAAIEGADMTESAPNTPLRLRAASFAARA